MNDTNTSWLLVLNDWVAKTASTIAGTLPSILGAIAILVIGWFIALLVRGIARRLLHGINRIMERIFRTGNLASARFSAPMITALAEVSFWIVVFIAITIAMRVAGFTVISGWLNQFVVHLPNFIVGILIIGFGYFSSIYVGKLVGTGAVAKKAGERLLLGRLIQAFIFTATLIMGLDQFGVEVTFLITLLTVVAGTVLVGFSIAFGFGARAHVSNLIAARTAQSALQVGLRIRIGEIEGCCRWPRACQPPSGNPTPRAVTVAMNSSAS
jgi:hypothetical protein